MDQMEDEKKVLVPTDKTNGYLVMEESEYVEEMLENLRKISNETSTKNINIFYEEAISLLEELKPRMSRNEYEGVKTKHKS